MLKRLIVGAYKVAGFAILTTILAGLASYVLLTAFYYVSSSWATPVIVSPSDRRVLELNAQLAQQETLHGQLKAQQLEMTLRLRDAQRTVAVERGFQARLRASLAFDILDRRAAVHNLLGLRRELDRASDDIIAANEDFAGLSRSRIKELYGAHLANRDELVKGNMELAALSGANLGLIERRMTLDERLRAENRQLASMCAAERLLGAALPSADTPEPPAPVGLTREVLGIQRDYALSMLAETRARDNAEALERSILTATATLDRYEALLSSIKAAPYLRAADRRLTIAFVPYANITRARSGAPVYACSAHVVWCRRVGTIGTPLEGEVTGQDPLRKGELRGVMVGIELDEMGSAREAVLHVGRAPLLF